MKTMKIRDVGSLGALKPASLAARQRHTHCVNGNRMYVPSLNRRSLMFPLGSLLRLIDCAGSIPPSDGAGKIVAIEDNVARIGICDRVAVCYTFEQRARLAGPKIVRS
jgi:hypothetical protein